MTSCRHHYMELIYENDILMQNLTEFIYTKLTHTHTHTHSHTHTLTHIHTQNAYKSLQLFENIPSRYRLLTKVTKDVSFFYFSLAASPK